MKAFISTTPVLQISRENNLVIIQNEFVKWVHDPEQGGELCGAFVKNGSNKNLLYRPQTTAVCPWVKGGWRQYHHYETVKNKAKTFEISQQDDQVILNYSSDLCDLEGETLKNVQVNHSVIYHASGAAEHTVTLDFKTDLDIGHVRIGTLNIVNSMNM